MAQNDVNFTSAPVQVSMLWVITRLFVRLCGTIEGEESDLLLLGAASWGSEALDVLVNQQPDVAILDVDSASL